MWIGIKASEATEFVWSDMLEETRERTSSLLVSALGAWLGLGAGLALMVFSLLVVSSLVAKGEDSAKASVQLNRTLGPDLTSVQRKGASVSEDGLILTLRTKSDEGAESEVVYTVQQGRLSRSDGSGTVKFIVRLDALHFSVAGNRVVAEWASNGKDGTEVWALQRWSAL